MVDRIAIPLPDGRWLALSPEQFDTALACGAQFTRDCRPLESPVADELLSAEQLAQRLKLPVNWVEEATRQGRLPHVRFGRYARYRLPEVIEAARRERRGGLSDQ